MRRCETQALLVRFNEAIDVASFQPNGAPAIRLRATGGVPVVVTSISSFGGASIQGAADQRGRYWLVKFVSQGIGDYPQVFEAIEPELRERECAIGWGSRAVAPDALPQAA